MPLVEYDDIARALERDRVEFDEKALKKSFKAIKQTKVKKEVEEAYDAAWEFEIWDRKTDVNGKPASEVLAHWIRIGWCEKGDSFVYFKKRKADGKIVMVQGRKPHVGGLMETGKDCQETIVMHRKADIELATRTEITNRVIEGSM